MAYVLRLDFRRRIAVNRPPLGAPGAMFLVLLSLLWGSGAVRADSFFELAQDLPLMAGMTEIAEQSVVFDKPDGRIVEAHAKGRLSRERVLRFYAEILPELGWRAAAAGSYRRDGELLRLSVSQVDAMARLKIAISPDEAGR